MSTPDFHAAMAALRQAAAEHAEITTDDVWPYLAAAPGERNVIGKAFSEAARLGLIEGTERFVRSRRHPQQPRRTSDRRADNHAGHGLHPVRNDPGRVPGPAPP